MMRLINNSKEIRTFVVGDIHGAHLALKQVLERSGFNRDKDLLITLGDICDGWPYVYECVEILLSIPNRIDIIGNHDDWFRTYIIGGDHPDKWIQGGKATATSYLRQQGREHMIVHGLQGSVIALVRDDIPAAHWKFFMHQNLYYIDTDRNMLFVHAGFDRENKVSKIRHYNPTQFYWDRELWQKAMSCKGKDKLKTEDDFDEIFIGHTATTSWTSKEEITVGGIILMRGAPMTIPMYSGGVWNIDTGAGWSGKLTIMDVDSKEFWQSDSVEELYPGEVLMRPKN